MKHLSLDHIEHKCRDIKLLLLDVDGVLTDGKLYFSNEGYEMKAFNTLDGQGIKLLRRSGVEVGIITGRTSSLVAKRAEDLGLTILKQGREDKFVALQELLTEHQYQLNQIAFMGDDYPDLTVMCRIGLALTVQNAHPAVVDHAHWKSSRKGGEGAVREACDLIMKAQDTYQSALDEYTRTDT
ncbi:KdsC family phosphatase [Teredinibacter purpureus]|uniref:KdsC family phosphatase n=1 Tax=Teredinibacter purpureus TaxID=2731756 RepID=UPI0005F7FF28|nr:HAD hydrolase family protein [Teredinibacter purpureus]